MNIVEQINHETRQLPNEAQIEVLDFVRFLHAKRYTKNETSAPTPSKATGTYQQAMQAYLSRQAQRLTSPASTGKPQRLPKREELYDRPVMLR